MNQLSPNKEVKYLPLVVCFLINTAFWILPSPEGLTNDGWHLLGLFITTILAIVIKPLPMGAIALIMMTVAVVTNLITIEQALNGFQNQVVWLVFLAFFIAKGFNVTGLGQRIALNFTKILGKKTLGLSYGLALSDLAMAPAIPSATARVGGVIYPVLQSISNSYNSYPNSSSAKRIGGFLIFTSFQITVITSAMFMTAMGANPVLVGLMSEQKIHITWGEWAIGAFLPGILSLIFIPIIIYYFFPPEVKQTPNAPLIAEQKIKKMGPISSQEYIMVFVMGLLLFLWSSGSSIGINPVTAAMIGLSILLVTQVLSWKELLKETKAWETFFWFSILIMLAKFLGVYGVISWMNSHMKMLEGISWWYSLPIIAIFYFYTHYFFASSTAHVTSMFPALLSLAIILGAPTKLSAYVLMYFSSLFSGLTHYSFAPAPMLYEAGYVELKTWWKLGFICSIFNILIWGTVGVFWWKILGIW